MSAIQKGGVGQLALNELGGGDTSPSSATDSQDETLEGQHHYQSRHSNEQLDESDFNSEMKHSLLVDARGRGVHNLPMTGGPTQNNSMS